jgi:hypothetical protein
MECLAVFLVAVILIGVTMTLASQAQSGADRWRRAFQLLARKYGGRHVSGGWLGRQSVHFRHGGTTVQVDQFSAGRPKRRYLQVHIGFPDPQLRCEAFPRRPGLRENPFRGMNDVATGAGSFDSEYIVRGESSEEVRRFFSDGVQLQMNRIRYVLGNDDVYVSAQRGRLLVKKEFPRHGGVEHIEDLVDWSLELYDQAMLTRSGSIEFVHRQTLETIDQCVCKVCGDELRDDVVLCRRCKTPHHRDCWLYYGACSTYGCREPEFMVPRIARPAPRKEESQDEASRGRQPPDALPHNLDSIRGLTPPARPLGED